MGRGQAVLFKSVTMAVSSKKQRGNGFIFCPGELLAFERHLLKIGIRFGRPFGQQDRGYGLV